MSGELTGQLVCYARSVAGVQWDRMEAGTLGEELNPWGPRCTRRSSAPIPRPRSSRRRSASGSISVRREEARNDRIHGAIGVIPSPLWIVLFFTSGLIFFYMLFFADSGERAVTQAMLMGTVVAVIVSMLLLLQFLDNPFHPGVGSLRPVAMERVLTVIDEELALAGDRTPPPCDRRGNAL